ncbi:MAG: LysR family transcriptional regulator [Deltaproteobacteria bacterium]|nr:LysR family transcriptional regulator [Deltaproteobacteria bacterium]
MNTVYERDLDLNLLRVFAVVAEEGSVTRAAARLYLTQPAVSAALRRLANFVGAELFARQGRGIALTARGSELLAASHRHLRPLVEAVMAPAAFDPASSTATVRLGLPDSAEGWALPLIVARLRAEAPSMVLVIVPVQFRTVEEALLSRRVDLALCVADELPRSVLRRPFTSAGFVCVYDPRHARLPKRLTERAYFAHEHVIVSYAGDLRGIVEDSLGKTRRVRVSVPAFSYVGGVVEGSSLLATVPEPHARYLLKTHPGLRQTALPFALEGAAQELLWLRTTDDDPVSRFVRGLIERALLPRPAGPRARPQSASRRPARAPGSAASTPR